MPSLSVSCMLNRTAERDHGNYPDSQRNCHRQATGQEAAAASRATKTCLRSNYCDLQKNTRFLQKCVKRSTLLPTRRLFLRFDGSSDSRGCNRCSHSQRSFSFLTASFSASVIAEGGGRKWDMTMTNCSKPISLNEPTSCSRWFLAQKHPRLASERKTTRPETKIQSHWFSG